MRVWQQAHEGLCTRKASHPASQVFGRPWLIWRAAGEQRILRSLLPTNAQRGRHPQQPGCRLRAQRGRSPILGSCPAHFPTDRQPLALARSGAAAAARGVAWRVSTYMLGTTAAALLRAAGSAARLVRGARGADAALPGASVSPGGAEDASRRHSLTEQGQPVHSGQTEAREACEVGGSCSSPGHPPWVPCPEACQSGFGGETPEQPGLGRCRRAWPGRFRSACLGCRTGWPARRGRAGALISRDNPVHQASTRRLLER